jgi:hypothetical protein
MRLAGNLACMREMRNKNKTLAGKPEGNRYLEDWEKNIETILTETVLKYADWIHVAQGRDQWRAFVKKVMNRSVP